PERRGPGLPPAGTSGAPAENTGSPAAPRRPARERRRGAAGSMTSDRRHSRRLAPLRRDRPQTEGLRSRITWTVSVAFRPIGITRLIQLDILGGFSDFLVTLRGIPVWSGAADRSDQI